MTTPEQARAFVLSHPCIEEIEGFLMGARMQLGEVPSEIMAPVETYRRDLMKGKVLPHGSRLPREWIYKKGRKPTRGRAMVRRT
jgi:hypothetical protein